MRRYNAIPPLVLAVALALFACSEGKPSAGADKTPAAAASDTAFGVCAPDAGGGMCSCEEPEPKRDAAPPPRADAPPIREFLRRLGTACAEKDLDFLRGSVRFPLAWRAVVAVKTPGGPPVTELRRIASPEELCSRKVFADVQGVDPAYPLDPTDSLGLTERGSQCRIETLVGQFGASLTLEKNGPGWTLVAVEVGD